MSVLGCDKPRDSSWNHADSYGRDCEGRLQERLPVGLLTSESLGGVGRKVEWGLVRSGWPFREYTTTWGQTNDLAVLVTNGDA